MGYDTMLLIDDRVVALWRKHASPLPRLLFRHDQVVIEGQEESEQSPIKVAYEATAGEILKNLESAGLGWHATIAAYSRVRVNGQAAGIVWAEALSEERTPDEVESRISQFKALPPVVDLEALGQVFVSEWKNPPPGSDGVPSIFREITYDSPIEAPGNSIELVYRAAKKIPNLEGATAARAIESWIAFYHDAPLLAWPMLICILLHHLDPDTAVVLDLTDDACESEAWTIEEARAYTDQYWLDASTSLSSFADTLGRLFSVLASFDSRLGRQFWFARAADLLGQLETVNNSGDVLPTKARGDALESLVEAIMKIEEPELQIIEKNFKTREEEIDLLLANGLADPFWTGLGSPLIMIECKNWKESTKPGVAELRVLESKMADRRSICKIGIFISMSGFSDTFMTRLKAIQSDGGMIFAVTGDDLSKIVTDKIKLSDWLKIDGLRQSLRGSSGGR